MKREIKFRAKSVNTGEWVESITISKGTIKRKRDNFYFELDEGKWVGVISETIGEFTGLLDKNGKDIYEGDIVIWEACDCEIRFGYHTVTVDSSGNSINSAYGFYLYFLHMKCDDPIDGTVDGNCEIIGNIHENHNQ
jgi:uncharacterized phage protein (TIGR01671 family)